MKKRTVKIGNLNIGGSSPVRIESMLKVPLSDLRACKEQIDQLWASGCELVRVAFPDISLVDALRQLTTYSPIPLMADIHFNFRLALAAIESGCPSIRLNPGNMGTSSELDNVVDLAKQNRVVIRIGANSGSLSRDILESSNGDAAKALVIAVEKQLELLLERDFQDIILSSKSTRLSDCLRSNYLLAQKYGDFPFHIGITESGPGIRGVVKSSCGLAFLLFQGIGDTLRVSLTDTPVSEVKTGFEILRTLGIRDHGPEIISCPTCGRKRADIQAIIKEFLPLIEELPDGFKFAVMGCEVNGPGEAKAADLGIAGTAGGLVIFRNGEVIADGQTDEMKTMLKKIIHSIHNDQKMGQ
ncbi:MAG: flavodoxin-dependent (E)-4-hydroxy-3-methylbut-2-enyl-diphosphate synthase [Synergistales bacterium]|nr:flavodoxin-dependent (E)-4-hydroxy-3-methylbut-2-enyl-diphosphate synthase [Synergistales bacterium]